MNGNLPHLENAMQEQLDRLRGFYLEKLINLKELTESLELLGLSEEDISKFLNDLL